MLKMINKNTVSKKGKKKEPRYRYKTDSRKNVILLIDRCD